MTSSCKMCDDCSAPFNSNPWSLTENSSGRGENGNLRAPKRSVRCVREHRSAAKRHLQPSLAHFRSALSSRTGRIEDEEIGSGFPAALHPWDVWLRRNALDERSAAKRVQLCRLEQDQDQAGNRSLSCEERFFRQHRYRFAQSQWPEKRLLEVARTACNRNKIP
ncbi:hypothetical protein C7476_105268 [Phyllobacterium bourgognense]|uniref:Uncharacterized protein n=1 Tax=Phyllobacterium bourgognense TaxID=314236 RepID=A0A368YUB6_9HYPH|nr:hypothetical protein C7476_105268 [Phyllobacterium bourgognense]